MKSKGTKLLKQSEVLQIETSRKLEAAAAKTPTHPKEDLRRRKISTNERKNSTEAEKKGGGEIKTKKPMERPPELVKSTSLEENATSSKKVHVKEFLSNYTPKKVGVDFSWSF